MRSHQENIIYSFESYRLDVCKRQLSIDGEPLPVTAKAFDTLTMLLSNAGEVVSKDELMHAIWPDTTVEENNLIQQISALRKILGERAGDHRFIVTISGRGYTFVAPVIEISPGKPSEVTARPGPKRSRRSMRYFEPGTVRGAMTAFSFMFLIALCFAWSHVRSPSRTQSLAVIQFRSAEQDASISTGISDTLRARLGSVEDLTVRPVATNGDRDALAAGRDMHVDSVLTGSVQRDHERIRVAVEMLDVADGRIIWGRTFDDNDANIFHLQDSIASEVARVLRVRLSSIGPDIPEGRHAVTQVADLTALLLGHRGITVKVRELSAEPPRTSSIV